MYRLITGLPKGNPLSAAVAVVMFSATAAVVSVRVRFDRRAGMHADGQVVVVVVVVGATVVFVGTSMSACITSSAVVVAVGCVVIGLVVSKGAVVVS